MHVKIERLGVLVPGLLEGPELAPDVTMLEGLSGEWEERDYRDVFDNVIGRQTLVREANDWHPHQPYAEQETGRAAEGLYFDPGVSLHRVEQNDNNDVELEL